MIEYKVLPGKVFEVHLYYDAEVDGTIVEIVHFYPGEIQREKLTQAENATTFAETLVPTCQW